MNIVNKDSKNTFTRMCIGEAVIRLLKDTDFDKIRITSVAKCAGVDEAAHFPLAGEKAETITLRDLE